MKRRMPVLGLLAVIAVGGCASSRGEPQPPNPQVAGTWVVDAEASRAPWIRPDTADAMPRLPSGARRPPGEGMGMPPIGATRPGGMDRDRPNRRGPAPDPKAVQAAMTSILARQRTLGLTVAGDHVTVRPEDGQEIVLPTDGESHELTLPGGEKAKVSATWEDGTLVIEHEHPGNVRIREVFSRNPGSDRLVAELSIGGFTPPEGRGMRVVYQPTPTGG